MEVTKRDGELELYDVEKIHQVVEWATEGINNVSSSDIEMNMNLSMRDKISTEEIHQIKDPVLRCDTVVNQEAMRVVL